MRVAFSRRGVRRSLLLALLGAGLAVLWAMRGSLGSVGWGFAGSHDFLEYWSAGRLLLRGANPYDPALMLALQRDQGWTDAIPLMMYNPPWILALYLPVLRLPIGVAAAVWLALQIALTMASGLMLWRALLPTDGRILLGALLACLFEPSLSALNRGQASPWLLFGVALFLWGQGGRRDVLAGLGLALLMIKPHVTYLFWLAALWWIWRERRWAVLAGWVGAVLAATGVVSLLAPDVLLNYVRLMSAPPLFFRAPVLGTWLRAMFGVHLSGLQYVPSLVGACGLLIWLRRRKGPWDWRVVAPWLLLASVPTAAYGWGFDNVVLVPVGVVLCGQLRHAAPRTKTLVWGGWAAIQALMLATLQARVEDFYSLWQPLALLGLYASVTFLCSRAPMQPREEAGYVAAD